MTWKGAAGWAAVAGGALSLAIGAYTFTTGAPDPAVEHTSQMALPAAGSAPSPAGSSSAPALQEFGNVPYDGAFTFVRVQFNSGRSFGGFGRGRQPGWAHDFPQADNNFVKILDEITFIQPHVDGTNVIAADDPELHRYPLAYVSEPGTWSPTQQEVDNISAYLRKGGFIILDDFRGQREWNWVVQIMNVVLPNHTFVDLDLEEPIFNTFFEIESLDFAPPTFQQYRPYFRGIYEDNDPTKRLMLIANFNNDIGDYWEYSDMGYYPIDLSNEAYKVGVNYMIYALTR